MIKYNKAMMIIMMVLSVLFCIGGVFNLNLAKMNKGVQISSGYVQNGELHITQKNEGTLGGSSTKEKKCKTRAAIEFSLCGVTFLTGIGYGIRALKLSKKEMLWKKGVILEKEKRFFTSIVVEFEDNTRKKLVVEPPVMVATGDRGVMGCKGDLLIEFNKNNT